MKFNFYLLFFLSFLFMLGSIIVGYSSISDFKSSLGMLLIALLFATINFSFDENKVKK